MEFSFTEKLKENDSFKNGIKKYEIQTFKKMTTATAKLNWVWLVLGG